MKQIHVKRQSHQTNVEKQKLIIYNVKIGKTTTKTPLFDINAICTFHLATAVNKSRHEHKY